MTERTRRPFGNVRKLPSGRYQARYTGPNLGEYKGPHTYTHHDDAIAFLSKTRRDIERGTWRPPGQDTDTTPQALRLASYARTWVAERRTKKGEPLRDRTRALYTSQLERHILPHLGEQPLDKLTTAMLRAWYNDLDGIGDRARSQTYALLRSILNTAVAEQLIGSNPCIIQGAGVTDRERDIVVLTVAELEALAEAMPERLRAAVLIEAWCGLRYGELAELRRKDIGEDAAAIRVERAVVRLKGEFKADKPKTKGSVRTVAVPPHLRPTIVEHLRRHTGRSKDALLFPNSGGGHMHHDLYTRWFKKAAQAIGREGLRPHDLRHLGGTLVALSGATVKEQMHRLGHTTSAMAMRYQHLVDGRDAQLAEVLSRFREEQQR